MNETPTLENIIDMADNSPIHVMGQKISQILWMRENQRRGSNEEYYGKIVPLFEEEPTAAAYLLKYANSPLAPARLWADEEVSTIREGVIHVGYEKAFDILLGVAMSSSFGGEFTIGSYSRSKLLANTLAVAEVSRQFSRIVLGESGDVPYASALIRNLGVIIEEQFARDQFARIIEKCGNGDPILDAEKEVLGYTHEEVIGDLARRWNYPRALTEIIANHHGEFFPISGTTLVWRNTIQISEEYVRGKDIGFSDSLLDPEALLQKYREIEREIKSSVILHEGFSKAMRPFDSQLRFIEGQATYLIKGRVHSGP